MTRDILYMFLLLFPGFIIHAQTSRVWVPDNGNGTYKNPILHADYSDPDAIRVGDDYYMTASSFNAVPGLPLLHSKDLVNWKLIGYALKRQPPYEHFSKPQHGNGVWAPSIRYHKGEFYIYYPDPDFGIYLTKAINIKGPWSEPVLVQAGKGLIDPCPLWDEDGKVYLVHAFAGSRAGIKSIIVIKQLNAAGTQVTDEGVLVYDGHEIDPTIEGPKLYKRNGYYYIFAPAGGVATGWQLVLRAKNIYGPYERRVVMDQGTTPINGPHQGAWVNTTKGADWFIHFQDKEAYGRVVHLQPMQWKNDWPVIGIDKDGDGKGEPVLNYKKPDVGKTYPVITPPDSDEFNANALGLQWQWHANPRSTWAYPYTSKGVLRIFSDKIPDEAKNLWNVPNLLLQKFPAEQFTATTKINFYPRLEGEQFGMAVMGTSYAYVSVIKKADGNYLVYSNCINADKGIPESVQTITKLSDLNGSIGSAALNESNGVNVSNALSDLTASSDLPDLHKLPSSSNPPASSLYIRVKVQLASLNQNTPTNSFDSAISNKSSNPNNPSNPKPNQFIAHCQFQYSIDGNNFLNAGEPFTAQPGRWIGAKIGFFCTRTITTNDAGYADIDWFRIE